MQKMVDAFKNEGRSYSNNYIINISDDSTAGNCTC